ncbi:DoxX family protein [Actinophytocola xinjiangensis]|uniref:DoxX family protein n=1 Tax=Actinophytocola xinjiangensis TaxID=485602 RepID=A0A7Z0WHE2_9PSEU|nr:DoxX family protein [Actinophytocola xinjiangensis]OLF06776.1 DoxX family protein [Actinophytocola xinjiangensis]
MAITDRARATIAAATGAPGFQDRVIGATRVVVAFLFVCHGLGGVFGLFGTVATPVGAWPNWWAHIIELVAGTAIALGLFTRPAALLCSGAMAFAYFTVHQPQALFPISNNGELAALFCWTFLLIAVIGPGAFALDNRRR